MTDPLSVSIIGRNEIDCHGLLHILSAGGFSILYCGTGKSTTALDGWKNEPSHLIIVDHESEADALIHCIKLRTAMHRARIVLMSDECDAATIREAFMAGVDGILAREIASKALISALQLVALGEKIMPSQFIEELAMTGAIPGFDDWSSRKVIGHLSDREIEILRHLVMGDPNKQIARKLVVAEATVKAHIKAILRKLQVGNRTQAAIWAISHGLDGENDQADAGDASKLQGTGNC